MNVSNPLHFALVVAVCRYPGGFTELKGPLNDAKEFVDWLASLGSSVVIEFPTREDPMVQKLLSAKREGLHPDYERGSFERCLDEAFDVQMAMAGAQGGR